MRRNYLRSALHVFTLIFRPRVLLLGLLLMALSVFLGCRGGAVSAPLATQATAPADPYAQALAKVKIFSQVVQDATASAQLLHATAIVRTDGTTATVLNDATYARVQAGLDTLATEGISLSNLLATRAAPVSIAAQLQHFTYTLANQLSPASLGIADPDIQKQYVIWLNVVNAGVTVLTLEVQQLIPNQESHLDGSGSIGPRAVAYGARAADPARRRANPEGPAPIAAGRPERVARLHQCGFRQGPRSLARHYA